MCFFPSSVCNPATGTRVCSASSDVKLIDVTPVTTGLGAPHLDRATYVILTMNFEHIQSERQLAMLATSNLLRSAAIALSLAGPVILVHDLVEVIDQLYLWYMSLEALRVLIFQAL